MAEIIDLDWIRSRRLPVAVHKEILVYKPNPHEIISMAADQSMADRLISWGESLVEITKVHPLTPKDRRNLMAALDATMNTNITSPT